MKRFIVPILTCICVLSPAASPALSTEAEQVEVRLRLIEVAVTGKKGHPITDLEREDFVVTVGGERREIRSFERSMQRVAGQMGVPDLARPVVTRAGLPEPEAAVAEESPGRWVVLCLDADRIPHNYRNIVLETARALVNEGRPQDRFAAVLLSNGELSYVHEFAPAREFNLRVLEDAGMLLTRSDDLRYRIKELVEVIKPCEVQQDKGSCVLTHSEEFLAVARRRTARGMASMRGLVSSMAPLPGRKALVWFSNGMLLRPGEIVVDAMTRYVGDSSRVESRLQDRGSFSYDNFLVEASRARVSFFSLRAGHDSSYDMRSAENATVPRALAGIVGNPYRLSNTMTQESLREVAEATGGRAVFTPLGPALAVGLLDRLDAVYTLGIDLRPGDRAGSNAKVKLVGRKGKVHGRKRLPVRVRVPADLVASLDAVPQAPNSAPDEYRLLLAVELERMGIEQTREFGKRSRVALYQRLTDDDGNEIDSSYVILDIPRNDDGQQHFVHWLTYSLEDGEYLAEVAVSDLVGKATTTVATSFEAGKDRED